MKCKKGHKIKMTLLWGICLFMDLPAIGQNTAYEKIWLEENFAHNLSLRKTFDFSTFDEVPIRTIVMRGDELFFDTYRGRFAKASTVKDSKGRLKITNVHGNINLSHYKESKFSDVDFYFIFDEESILVEKRMSGKRVHTLRCVLVNKQLSNIAYPTAEAYLLLNGSFKFLNPLHPYFQEFQIEFKLDGTVISPLWKEYTIIQKGNMIENVKTDYMASSVLELVDKKGAKTSKMLLVHSPSEFRLYDFTLSDKGVYHLDNTSYWILRPMTKHVDSIHNFYERSEISGYAKL